ncbi:hypothetical protein RCO48_22405 [Peribacillus frigoritolerans]|nr:hypothetical protein [Peribacillus frigoritolerans]
MARIRSINGNGDYVYTHKMVKFIQVVNDSKVHRNTNFCMLKSRRKKERGENIIKKIIKYWVGSNTCFLDCFFAIAPMNKTYALSYDNTNPYSTGCVNKSPITYETEYIYKNGVKIGYVQLKGSAYCHTAWGSLKFYSATPYDYYANVWVDSFNGTTKRAFTKLCQFRW